VWIKITKAFTSFKIGDVVKVADKFGKLVIGKDWAEESSKPKKESLKETPKTETKENKEPKAK